MARFARTASGDTPEGETGITAAIGRDISPSSVAIAAALLLPAALTVYASFQSGGFFVGTPAVLAVVMGLGLVLRITQAARPFEGFGRGLALATGAFGLYCAWLLLSASWSDAPIRAMVEFDRALLYWLLLVLLGSLARDDGRVAWALRALALAMATICAIALVTRLFPNAIDVAPEVAERRLGYPLTYWNALGLMAAIALILTFHLTASERESTFVRLAAAAALPVLAATLYFTFSRGAAAVAVGGLLVYCVVGRPRSLLVALAATGPAVAIALMSAYGADLLAGDDPISAAAAAEGEDVAGVVFICMIAAVALRALGLPLDERLRRIRVSSAARRRATFAATGTVLLAVLVMVTAFNAVGKVADRVEGFAEDSPASADDSRDNLRDRLSDPGNNGRLDQWQVAIDGFESEPLTGNGAGTSALLWARERPEDLKAEDAHSLYLENLSEVGLVGTLLLLTTLGAILVAFARRARGEHRHVYAALLGAGLAWAVHAGVDWDWEMPAISLWVFALGGMALARRPGERDGDPEAPADGTAAGAELGNAVRVALAVGCLALLVTPALMALSQRELNRSVAAFKQSDCGTATRAAVDAAKLVSARPQPYVVLGYCNARAGNHDLAERMFRTAISRDPESWENYYGLAIVQGAAGRDPRPAIRTARSLNPREALIRDAVERFDTADPQKWERRASDARLPIL